jgi:dipeptidyl aminopeptidase/acylaminoacyl peptidase
MHPAPCPEGPRRPASAVSHALAVLPAVLLAALLVGLLGVPASAAGQGGTVEDYERARTILQRLPSPDGVMASNPVWIDETNRFWYRRGLAPGHEFILVDAEGGTRAHAFDHDAVAAALAEALGRSVEPRALPFNTFSFHADGSVIRFQVQQNRWRCDLAPASCRRETEAETEAAEASDPSDEDAASEDGPAVPNGVRASPDGKWWAFIHNYNVAIRPAGVDDFHLLSWDGSEGNFYMLNSIRWAPDSQKLAVYRRIPGYDRQIPYIESAPDGQLQPRHFTRYYQKPGDVVNRDHPVIFNLELNEQFVVDDALFPNAYGLQRPHWHEDARAFVFGYNERGHQRYRMIEVDAATGTPRTLVEERSDTFVHYSGGTYLHYVDDGRELVWMSERSGWNHLYLYDGETGRVKNPITSGDWVVRGVDRVDDEARQVWFQASGMNSDQDPYLVHHYRVNFDGSGLVALTEADGNHQLHWSPDRSFYVARWSRVDQPPVAELRRASDQALLLELERGDLAPMLAAGWTPVEPFGAEGRDGETDIWGVIVRPTDFDPTRRYPVIEYIYAGPHDSFVPKSFTNGGGMLALAELGFIVVQIDGMGTANRSKAFHDVAWRNLGDAGFPDRILWHQAVAEVYPWYDISRVGIYGTSAGGQSSTGALLFHPDFYHVAVSFVGCHDNRMDKIWWNEQWMGWPLGPHYSAASNVDNAHRLQGRLLLMVGELDTNVDPQSTIQVADALIRANRDFDLLFMPGTGHSSGGAYGTRRRNDYFVQHLLGVTPPDWNRVAAATTVDGAAGAGGGGGAGAGAAAGAGSLPGAGLLHPMAHDPLVDGWMEIPAAERDPRAFDPHAW